MIHRMKERPRLVHRSGAGVIKFCTPPILEADIRQTQVFVVLAMMFSVPHRPTARPDPDRKVCRRHRDTFREARDKERDRIAERLESCDLSAVLDEASKENAVAAGQLAAVVEFCEAKIALAQDENVALHRDLRHLRARVAQRVDLTEAPVEAPVSDDDDDDDWVPPSARVVVPEESELARAQRLLADEQAAHRATRRSLETQILKRDAQLRKLQVWADDISRRCPPDE